MISDRHTKAVISQTGASDNVSDQFAMQFLIATIRVLQRCWPVDLLLEALRSSSKDVFRVVCCRTQPDSLFEGTVF